MFTVSESKLVFENKTKTINKLYVNKFFSILLFSIIMAAIIICLVILFRQYFENNIEGKISFCSAIITLTCAVITITTLMADRQFRIYDDSLNIFNSINKKQKDKSDSTPVLHRWYCIKKFKTYRLTHNKKLYSQMSDATITFYINNIKSIKLNIPLTRAEWQFISVTKNYFRMLFNQKHCIFEAYSEHNEDTLLMWETVLSLYKSVLINKTMNLIRLINILSIPAVLIIMLIY
jgi:hypothetical protein